jgi:hypothetical protein
MSLSDKFEMGYIHGVFRLFDNRRWSITGSF